MQFTNILALVALAPFLATANPVGAEDMSALERRGGKDFCGSDLRSAGDACTFGGGENDPHACGIKDRAVVVSPKSAARRSFNFDAMLTWIKLYCKNGIWEIDHRCATGQLCQCDKGTPKRGNLVCR